MRTYGWINVMKPIGGYHVFLATHHQVGEVEWVLLHKRGTEQFVLSKCVR